MLAFASFLTTTNGYITLTETETTLVLSNDRLYMSLQKSPATPLTLTLYGQDLLGTGKGPYVDCHCVPSGSWVPGNKGTATYTLIKDIESTGTPYAGIVMQDTYASTNQSIEQYWLLREGETGLHMFTRVYYYNESQPFLNGMGELRTPVSAKIGTLDASILRRGELGTTACVRTPCGGYGCPRCNVGSAWLTR
jgi:rhamnogalacturonan endolyase